MTSLGFSPNTRSVVIVGDYGSGKTEIAVNLAIHLAQQLDDRSIAIADLDLVNPYFRCREAVDLLELSGVRVVAPEGGHRFADLPILLPQVKGLLQSDNQMSILDVGGDEVGSRVLAGLAPVFDPERHELWFVVNTNRPFNDTVDGCIGAVRRIELASGLRVSGLISNTHLMRETTLDMVRIGLDVSERVAYALGVPVRLVAAMASLDGLSDSSIGSSSYFVLRMRRLMVPPWLRREVIPKGRGGSDIFRLRSS